MSPATSPPATEADPGGISRLRLDPRRANHVTILGKKGSGKSVLAHRFWTSYRGNKLVIDPTGDVDPGEGAENLTLPLPTRWPTTVDDKPQAFRFKPDMKSTTFRDDMDRAVGLAYVKGHCLLWVDEMALLTTAHTTPPHTRELLHTSRHRGLSILFCGPRPLDLNPLVMSQADYLAVFKTPNPDDRKRIASVAGIDQGEFDEALNEATAMSRHAFVWVDQHTEELLVCPPLPTPRQRTNRRFDPPDPD